MPPKQTNRAKSKTPSGESATTKAPKRKSTTPVVSETDVVENLFDPTTPTQTTEAEPASFKIPHLNKEKVDLIIQQEQQKQADQLKKATKSVIQTVADNQKKDLIETTSALNKLANLPTEETREENFHSSYNPETSINIFEKLESLESTQTQCYNDIFKTFEKKLQRQISVVEEQTTNILEATTKAKAAANYHAKCLEEIHRILSGPAYNSWAGKNKLSILFNHFSGNIKSHNHFIFAQDRSAKYLRKIFGLPTVDTQNTHSESVASTSATTETVIVDITKE